MTEASRCRYGSYRHITLAMLAYAYLVVAAANNQKQHG